MTALYLEKDEAGQEILAVLYQAKQTNPDLEVKILSIGIVPNVDVLAKKPQARMRIGTPNKKPNITLKKQLNFGAYRLTNVKFSACYISKVLSLTTR